MTDANAEDRGLLYGEACFETMRVIDGRIFAWDAHLARLTRGLAAFGLDCPGGLLSQCLEAASGAGNDVLLRLTVSGGEAERGLLSANGRRPRVHIHAWPWRSPHEPLQLRTLAWPLFGVSRIAKFTADYAFTIRLLYQARHAGLLAEGEQALFSLQDELLCMETGNLLLCMDGEWLSPQHEAVLPGIVRSALLDAGVLRCCRCPVDWLQGCEAMAVCNSGSFIRPVGSVNGRRLENNPDRFAPLIDALRGRPGVPRELACA